MSCVDFFTVLCSDLRRSGCSGKASSLEETGAGLFSELSADPSSAGTVRPNPYSLASRKKRPKEWNSVTLREARRSQVRQSSPFGGGQALSGVIAPIARVSKN